MQRIKYEEDHYDASNDKTDSNSISQLLLRIGDIEEANTGLKPMDQASAITGVLS